MKIRLTPGQRSALECAGLDIAELTADEQILAAAWTGDTLIVTTTTREPIYRALTDRSNAEDYIGSSAPTTVATRAARRASRSLGSLASRVLRQWISKLDA